MGPRPMTTATPSPPPPRITLALGLNVALIVALSVWGRPLLAVILQTLSRNTLGVTLQGLALGVLGGLAVWLYAEQGPRGLLHLLWLLPVGALLELSQQTLEERIHIPLFGVLGFLAARLWPPGRAILLGLGVAGGDELLQAWLPDRVGEWRDAAVNGAAVLIGLVVATAGRRRG